jgi:hypothetical protein
VSVFVCASCGQERSIAGRGLCAKCYRHYARAGTLKQFPTLAPGRPRLARGVQGQGKRRPVDWRAKYLEAVAELERLRQHTGG